MTRGAYSRAFKEAGMTESLSVLVFGLVMIAMAIVVRRFVFPKVRETKR